MNRKLYLMGAVILAKLLLLLPGAGYAAPVLISAGTITESVYNPTCLAMDSQGNVYASETIKNKLKVYNRQGKWLKDISVPEPRGVAVDSSGYIYVGSAGKHGVDVYAPDYSYVRSLGIGAGEISRPVSIAVDNAGKVYVLDSATSMVRIYDSSTAQLVSSFGGIGSTVVTAESQDGLFNKPTALAVSADEIYVGDRPKTLLASGATIDGAKIQVFDKTGTFKRSFGNYGIEAGQIGSPAGLALDGFGNIFIADYIQGAALSFDAAAGTFNNIVLADSLKPVGTAIGKNKIAYVSTYNRSSIDKFGLDGYTTMDEAPAALNFESRQQGVNAPTQAVTISNTGNGSLGWSAVADSGWITLGAASGTTGPNSSNSLVVGTNNAGMATGTVQGVVTVTSDFGQIDRIPVTFKVNPVSLIGFSNGTVAVAAQQGTTPVAPSVTIEVQTADPLSWSASSDASWLGIFPASGTATTVSALSISTGNLAAGTFVGHITLSASGASGDGSKLTVSLTVTQGARSISVTSNIPEAGFTVASADGSYSQHGSGMAWNVENAPVGNYTITFDAVAGYRKPLSQTRNLGNAGITVSGNYLSLAEMAGRTNIVAASLTNQNRGTSVKFYKNDGTPTTDKMVLGRYGTTTIASADIDGDGVAELIEENIVSNRPAMVRILKSDGSTLATFAPYTTYGRLSVAAGDLNGDGKAEIVVAPASNDMNALVKVYTFKADIRQMVATGIEIAAFGYGQPVVVAVADTRDNAAPKLVAASHNALNVWTINASQGVGNWTASPLHDFTISGRGVASLTAGDVDGDGMDEIIAGEAGMVSRLPVAASRVMIFKTDGTPAGVFVPFATFSSSLSVAAADLTADGIAEVIVGSGPAATRRTPSRVGIFNAAGTLSNTITPYANSQGGVNVTVGEMGL